MTVFLRSTKMSGVKYKIPICKGWSIAQTILVLSESNASDIKILKFPLGSAYTFLPDFFINIKLLPNKK